MLGRLVMEWYGFFENITISKILRATLLRKTLFIEI